MDKDISKLLRGIKNSKENGTTTLLQELIKQKIKELQDIPKLHLFITQIYENLYYDIIFKNINITKKTVRHLESLTTPLTDISVADWKRELGKFIFRN
jgi:hypothetical protein